MSELYHYGKKGMKWGHRKTIDYTKVYSKKAMTDEQRSEYAKIRLQTVGIRKAIADEDTQVKKQYAKAAIIGGLAIAQIPVATILAGQYGATKALNVLGFSTLGSAMNIHNVKKNANENVISLYREAGLSYIKYGKNDKIGTPTFHEKTKYSWETPKQTT